MEQHAPNSSYGLGRLSLPPILRTSEKPVSRDDAAQLRARLLKMIVTNEEQRQSPHADSLKPR